MSEPAMGETAKDEITNFIGIVTGRSVYINGCVHLMLEAKAKEGMKPVHAWFDADRCVQTSKTSTRRVRSPLTRPTTSRPGGPMPHSI